MDKTATNYTTDELFESAVSIVRTLPKEGPFKPTDDLKLKFYAYFKQATYGPNTTPKPRFYQIVESYKWDAWHKLGDMSKDVAKENYISQLKQCMESFPIDEGEEDMKYFEDVLGKRFYDYWFSRFAIRKQQELDSQKSKSSSKCNNDNHSNSNSSTGSSVSMLEEATTSEGFKTPITSDYKSTSLTHEMSDQFALAILRLQHGVEDSLKRLNDIEGEIRNHTKRLANLESPTRESHSKLDTNRSRKSLTQSGNWGCGRGFLVLLRQFNWFNVAWPLVVYLILRSYERRRQRLSR